MRPLSFVALLPLVVQLACHKDTKDGEEETDVGTDSDTGPSPYAGDDLGSWLSMKATTDGKPAIAFYDRTQDALGYAVGTISGSDVSWAIEAVDSYPDDNGLNPGDSGRYASMVMSAAGDPWIVYQDTSNGSLKYATKSAGTWTVGGADSGTGSHPDAGNWATVALDLSGNPVAAHYDRGAGTLRVTRWNGTAWASETILSGEDYTPPDDGDTSTTESTVPANLGEYAKIAVGPSGTEYIAFYDRAWGALRLAMHPSGGAWTVETVDDSADVGQWPDVVIDGGQLYIAYQDITNQDLKLAVGTPGSWSIETVDSGDHVGADTALAVEGGVPQIVYFDGYNNDMKRAQKSGSSWSAAKVAGDGTALGYHNETVSLGGVRYAACYDFTNRTVWFTAL